MRNGRRTLVLGFLISVFVHGLFLDLLYQPAETEKAGLVLKGVLKQASQTVKQEVEYKSAFGAPERLPFLQEAGKRVSTRSFVPARGHHAATLDENSLRLIDVPVSQAPHVFRSMSEEELQAIARISLAKSLLDQRYEVRKSSRVKIIREESGTLQVISEPVVGDSEPDLALLDAVSSIIRADPDLIALETPLPLELEFHF